jgi:hypothetical protein
MRSLIDKRVWRKLRSCSVGVTVDGNLNCVLSSFKCVSGTIQLENEAKMKTNHNRCNLKPEKFLEFPTNFNIHEKRKIHFHHEALNYEFRPPAHKTLIYNRPHVLPPGNVSCPTRMQIEKAVRNLSITHQMNINFPFHVKT